jgi:hypothetical protein
LGNLTPYTPKVPEPLTTAWFASTRWERPARAQVCSGGDFWPGRRSQRARRLDAASTIMAKMSRGLSPGRLSVTYRITSSARPSSDGGIVSPRALAVLRLMTRSNFVGCSTGRSRGLAPLRILST